MELTSAQRQRQVRMANTASEMIVLRGLPKRTDAMQRYTSLKRRRLARSIQVWYRRHRKEAPQPVATPTAPTQTTTLSLPSDVSGLLGGTRMDDDTLLNQTSATLASTSALNTTGSSHLPPLEAPPSLPAYSSTVRFERLQALEERLLAKGRYARSKENLDGLRDKSDVGLSARFRRQRGLGPIPPFSTKLAKREALLTIARHLQDPPQPGTLLTQALEAAEKAMSAAAAAAVVTGAAGAAVGGDAAAAAAVAVTPLPTPSLLEGLCLSEKGRSRFEPPTPTTITPTPTTATTTTPLYRYALDKGGLNWPLAAGPLTRAHATKAHTRAMDTMAYLSPPPPAPSATPAAPASTTTTTTLSRPWWRVLDTTLCGDDCDVRAFQFHLHQQQQAHQQQQQQQQRRQGQGQGQGQGSQQPAVVVSAPLPPPPPLAPQPLPPVVIPGNFDPLGSVTRARDCLGDPHPPPARPLYSVLPGWKQQYEFLGGVEGGKRVPTATPSAANANPFSTTGKASGMQQHPATPAAGEGEVLDAASKAWVALVCSPFPGTNARHASATPGAAVASAAAAAPSSSPPFLDNTLGNAARVLGVVDPWSTSAALIDPAAVSAAVRAAATALGELAMGGEGSGSGSGSGGGSGEGWEEGSQAAITELATLLTAPPPPAPPASSSHSSRPPPYPIEDLVDLTTHLFSHPSLHFGGESPTGPSAAALLGLPPSAFPTEFAVGGESIAKRISGAYEALRRGVIASDALACLEEEDERGRVVGGMEDGEEGGRQQQQQQGAGRTPPPPPGATTGAKSKGRPPMASLTTLTREVRARAIQRAWRRHVVCRRARGELERRRRARIEGGRVGRVRSAVISLVQALQSSGVNFEGELGGGGGGGSGGGDPHNLQALLNTLPAILDSTTGGGGGGGGGAMRQQQQQQGGRGVPQSPRVSNSSGGGGGRGGGALLPPPPSAPALPPYHTQQPSAPASSQPPYKASAKAGAGGSGASAGTGSGAGAGATTAPSSSRPNSASSLGRNTFFRYSERDAVAVSAAAAADAIDSRPTVLVANAGTLGGRVSNPNSVASAAAAGPSSALDSSLGLIVKPREWVQELPPITIEN